MIGETTVFAVDLFRGPDWKWDVMEVMVCDDGRVGIAPGEDIQHTWPTRSDYSDVLHGWRCGRGRGDTAVGKLAPSQKKGRVARKAGCSCVFGSRAGVIYGCERSAVACVGRHLQATARRSDEPAAKTS